MFYEKRKLDFSSAAIDADPASMGEIFETSYRSTKLGFEILSQEKAIEEAYDQRLKAIFEATGQRRENPMRTYVPHDQAPIGVEAAPARDLSAGHDFQLWLDELAAAHPDKLDAIRPDLSPYEEARRLAREAETAERDAWDRTPGVGKYVPYIGANLAAAATDPTNVLALLPGVGQVGSGAKQVLWAGVKAGAANAAQEAVAQPFVQGWRQFAGLDYGISQAALQVTFAGMFGFAADAGIRGAYRGAKLGTRSARNFFGGETPPDAPPGAPRDRPLDALDEAARAAPEGSTLRRASEGDEKALRDVAELTGAVEDPAVRGALQELERYKLFGAPPEIDRGEHLARLAGAIQRSLDPEALPPGEAIIGPEPVRAWPELRDDAGAAETVDGKPVHFRAIDARRSTQDGEVLESMRQGRGAAIAFETADGRFVIQRQAARELEAEGAAPAAHVFREADGWTLDDARVFAARKSLEEMSGSPLDMAILLRRRPDLADRTLPLSDYKFKQSVGLARLSDEAFERVLSGELPAHFGALIGNHVPDAGRHAGLVGELAGAKLKSVRAAKAYLGQTINGPVSVEDHAIRFGGGAAVRDAIAERVAVLDQALAMLAKDKRVFSVLEREAPRIRRAGNVLDDEANVERQELAKRLAGLISKLSETPSRVSDLVQAAALEVASGVAPKIAAKNLVRQVADILERDGIRGLARQASANAADTTLNPRPMKDPFGPEAQAQTEALKVQAAEREKAAAVTDERVREVMSDLAYLADMKDLPRPEGLASWLKRRGGLVDQDDEISVMLGGARMRPGLISKKGANLDDATLAAWEEGFLSGAERPTINDLLDALDDDLRGNAVVREADRAILQDIQAADELRSEYAKQGLSERSSEDRVRAALGEREAPGQRGQGALADEEAAGLGGAPDAAGELGDVPFAIGGDVQRRRTAHFMLKTGRSVHIAKVDSDAILALTRPHLDLVPDGVDFGVLIRLDPVAGSKKVTATFRRPDGSTFEVATDARIVTKRAVFNSGGRQILLTSFSYSAQTSRRIVGELAHEAVHARKALNKFGVGSFGRLLGHAQQLRVLDMEFRTFLQAIGAEVDGVEPGVTIRDIYEVSYEKYRQKDDLIAEEAVAHMVELFVHRQLLPQEAEPIIADLAQLLGNSRKKTADVVQPLPVNDDEPIFAIAGSLKAKTANMVTLDQAQQMELAGVNYFRILQETGWERGADGRWRFEISDREAKLTGAAKALFASRRQGSVSARAEELFDNPLVFEAYPELRGYQVTVIHKRDTPDRAKGFVDVQAKKIVVQAASPLGVVKKLVHEFQHVIQRAENFAQGGGVDMMRELMKRAVADANRLAANAIEKIATVVDEAPEGWGAVSLGYWNEKLGNPLQELVALRRDVAEIEREAFRELYLRLAGEVEARNVETRLKFRRGERLGTSMRFTEDVPREQQIIRRGENIRFLRSGDEWEDNWFDQLAQRSVVIEQAEWQKSQRAVPAELRGKAAMERAADDFADRVAAFERELWDAGDTAQEIAAKVSNKFGFPVDPEQVASRQVWWRVDDLIGEIRPGKKAPADVVDEIRRLRDQNVKTADITAHITEKFQREFKPNFVTEIIRNYGIGRSKNAWTPDAVSKLAEMFRAHQATAAGAKDALRSWLRKLRVSHKNVSLTEIARAGGVKRQLINDAMRDGAPLPAAAVEKIAKAYGVEAPALPRPGPVHTLLAEDLSRELGRPFSGPSVDRQLGLAGLTKNRRTLPKPRKETVWSDDAIAALTSKDVEGMTANQIALFLSTKFDREFTRDSVIGKRNRIKVDAARDAWQQAQRPQELGDMAKVCRR